MALITIEDEKCSSHVAKTVAKSLQALVSGRLGQLAPFLARLVLFDCRVYYSPNRMQQAYLCITAAGSHRSAASFFESSRASCRSLATLAPVSDCGPWSSLMNLSIDSCESHKRKPRCSQQLAAAAKANPTSETCPN